MPDSPQSIETLDQLAAQALAELTGISDSQTLEHWHTTYLGRKGKVTLAVRRVGELPKEERPAFGQHANRVKQQLEAAYEERARLIKAQEMERSLAEGAVDVTLPGHPVLRGRLHPSIQTLRRILQIWADMGFQVYRSRDVETDEYNFQLLNFPPHHPARDMQDTFYTTQPDVLLRTHTSPGQIHAMRAYCPQPIRVVLPGMCYRYEQITARSEIQFHQVEGLAVGYHIRFTDLKGTLTDFAQRMFGAGRKTRFRASYFPFTEPSAEMDVECILCHGKGCRLCKYTGWLEILGCGMVHPVVLQNGGYDPTIYSGYAFGMGVERIAMLCYGIEDIRYFWGNDLRFLEQF
ncbi:MAG: phenylalanine--tRNA ligase subunit alpha [Ardenticatenia bacterium]|nr:MAG: phenylalanine--tRNA ligase subunit alpha [Ardenticatenia bacterium]